MNRTAVLSTRFCHAPSCGSVKVADASSSDCGSQPRKCEDLRGRVGGFRARHRVARQELEVVLLGGMVGAQAEQARHGLGAEAGRNREAGCAGAVAEGGRRVGELERAHEPCVELGHGDRGRGARCGARRLLGQAGHERGELALGQGVGCAERGDGLRHQPVGHDVADRGLRPGRRRAGGLRARGLSGVADLPCQGGRRRRAAHSRRRGPGSGSSVVRIVRVPLARFRLGAVDAEIRPEPQAEERDAILRAVEEQLHGDARPPPTGAPGGSSGIRENLADGALEDEPF